MARRYWANEDALGKRLKIDIGSYAVTERTQEIGIRMALGAQTADVLKLVVRNGLGLALVGVAFGLAGAFALQSVVWRSAYRCNDVRRGLAGLIRRRTAGVLPARAARDESRSAGGAAVRMNGGWK
jgi:hypothetical protein